MTARKSDGHRISVSAAYGVRYEFEALDQVTTEELRTIATCMDKMAAFGSAEIKIHRLPKSKVTPEA